MEVLSTFRHNENHDWLCFRYYYDKNIIHKTAGKRYVYRFVCDMQNLTGGYTPEELWRAYGLTPQKDKDED